ncbi:MAG TPA: M56 family metallopeptidase [Pirellulales bacterium]|nr:M56 family metallopeptidase [Pirellulales bacterium]
MNWLDGQTALFDGAIALVRFGGNWLLQSALLIAIGLAAGRLLARRGSAAQSAVYRTTLAAVLACPLASLWLAHTGFAGWSLALPGTWVSAGPGLASADIKRSELLSADTIADATASPPPGALPPPPAVGEGEPAGSENETELAPRDLSETSPVAAAPEGNSAAVKRSIPYSSRLALALSALWIAIAAVRLAGLGTAWWRLASLRTGASPASEATAAACRALATRLGIAAPAVLHSPCVVGPCLAGLRRPVILLPERDLGPRLSEVLVHELAHFARGDCGWNLLRQIGLAILFHQPLLWILSRRLEATAEEVCDDYVVQYGGDRAEYAYCLIEVAEHAIALPLAAGVGIVRLRSMLAHRVGRIMDTSRPLSTRIGNLLFVLVLIGGLAGIAIVGPLGIVSRPAVAKSTTTPEPSSSGDVKTDDGPPGTTAAAQPAAPAAVEAENGPRSPAPEVKFHRIGINLASGAMEVFALAFSAKDEFLVVGGGDGWNDQQPGHVRVWDFARRKQIAAYDTPRGIHSVALSPDGRRLAYGSWSGEIWLRAVGHVEMLHEQMDGPARVALSPDGKMLVAATERGQMKAWNATDGEPLEGIEGGGFAAYWIGFSPDGKYLAATGGKADEADRPKLAVWDVAARHLLYERPAETGPILCGSISPDGKTLATGGGNSIALWDLATGSRRGQTAGLKEPINRVEFSPDGKQLVSSVIKPDGPQMNLWDLASGKTLGEFSGHRGHVRAFVFTRDGKQLITGSADRSVRMWGLADRKQTGSLQGLPGARDFADAPVTSLAVAFAPDGNGVATADDNGQVNLYCLTPPRLARTWRAHSDAAAALAYAPDGSVLASGGYDKQVKLWNPATGDLIRSLAGHAGWVVSLAFSHDGKTLATGSYDRTLRLWNVADGTELKAFKGYSATVRSLAFSHDDRLLASGSADRTVRVWDVASGEALPNFAGHDASVRSVAFSADDGWLASAGEDNVIKIWDVGRRQLHGTLTGHTDIVSALAFAEGTLISSSWDHSVRTWDAAALKPREQLMNGPSEMVALAVTPHGDRLLAVGADQSLTFFNGLAARSVAKTRPLEAFRDDFSDRYDSSWKIVREDSSHLSLTKRPGCLTITTQLGTIYGPASTAPGKVPARNLFLRPAPAPDMGDFSITLAVDKFEPTAFLQQVALVCYDDDDNYLKWSFERREKEGATHFVMVRESEAQDQHDLLLQMPAPKRLWLRLTKRGNDYEGAYSTDGRDFKVLAARRWGYGAPQFVGFIAKNGRNTAAEEIDVEIDSFELAEPADTSKQPQ